MLDRRKPDDIRFPQQDAASFAESRAGGSARSDRQGTDVMGLQSKIGPAAKPWAIAVHLSFARQMRPPSERELVLRAASGDCEAFSTLVERSRPWLFGLCFRLVRDRGTAEDTVQEALLRAFRDLPRLRQPDRFRAWLSRIAVNACRMYLRQRRTVPEQLTPMEHHRRSPRPAADPPLGVDEALARLDAETRRILMLFYADGLSQREVGELAALSPAAVKSRLHRARERLRREMIAMMGDDQKVRLGITEEAPWSLRTIVLVEPDDTVREPLRHGLTTAGYEVIVLSTGEQALAAVGEKRAQLLILDKQCGEPHWIEVLTLLQADAWSRDNVPVAVLIDRGNERDRALAWQAGAMLCLARSAATDEIVGFVKRLERLWQEERSA